MAKLIAVFAVALGLIGAAFASASSLSVNGGAIQAGSTTSVTCQTDSVKVVAYGLNTLNNGYEGVAYVTVSNIDPKCDGAFIYGRLTANGVDYYTSATNENGKGGPWGVQVSATGTITDTYTLYFKSGQAADSAQAYIPAENIADNSLKIWLATD